MTTPDGRLASDVDELARDVLIEAFGASATPFVPLPFVDGWMLARLLRRIAVKVLARRGRGSPLRARAIVQAYVKAGTPSLGGSLFVGAARFLVRKAAVVLDVKRSHDVFGECVAFALALDLAAERGLTNDAAALGDLLHRTVSATPSGALDALVRAGRDAVTGAARRDRSNGGLGEALSGELAKLRDRLQSALDREAGRRAEP